MRTDILLFTALSLATLNAFPADYYVDSSGGSDSASGTSPEQAWKTLARTRQGEIKPGDTIRLACGRVWREQLIPVSGEKGKPVTYTSYSPVNTQDLPPPAIQSSLDRSKPSDWKKLGDGLWTTENVELDVGLLVFNHGEKWGVKKWNDDKWTKGPDKRYAKSIGIRDELDFWCDEKKKRLVL